MKYRTLVLLVAISSVAIAEDHGRARKSDAEKASTRQRFSRALADDNTADIMARNILEWLQGLYRSGSRKPRQQSENAYLPPYSTQRPPEKPRPFQPPTTPQPSPTGNEISTGNIQRPSTSILPPAHGYSSKRPFPPFSSSSSPYGSASQAFPTSSAPKPFSPSPATSTTYLPPGPNPPSGATDAYPDYDGYPGPEDKPQPGFPPSSGGTTAPGTFPDTSGTSPGTVSTPVSGGGGGSSTVGVDTTATTGGSRPTTTGGSGGISTTGAGRPGTNGGSRPTTPGGRPTTPGGRPTTPGGTSPTSGTSGTSVGTTPGRVPTGPDDGSDNNIPGGDDSKHPPHIHAIDVECGKTMMTINIEFNRQFDGLIYSKGFYNNPECRYVEQNSGQKEYKFTVNLDSCGTQFINDFEGEAGQAYLENVLVLQNEPGIQEVWDTIRSVRCLWEGNINKALTVTLSVDMLNQEIVTFSGDTASAKLDIQIGKGPFAPAANGLVKIGETMTLVVSVEGDPGFDLHVRDCIARDESSTNVVQLTDERGCILKPKFFGAFQKTRETGNTGASIIAYAFFQAFKFPDVMDLFIECNVELCKTDCESCPDSNQQIEPGRRRRSVISALATNSSVDVISSPVKVTRGFKVVMPEDLSPATTQALRDISSAIVEDADFENHLCLCDGSFYAAFSIMFTALTLTTISAAVFYAKLHRLHMRKCDFSRES